MLSSILKWLAALGVGAATAAAQYLAAQAGHPIEGVDPLVSGIIVTLFTKLVTWLTAKLPA